MKIKVNIFLIIALTLTLLGCVAAFSLSVGAGVAYADSYVSASSVTATCLTGFDAEGRPVYAYGGNYYNYLETSGSGYAKDITVTFMLTDAAYYVIDCVKEGTEPLDDYRLESVPLSGKVSYEVEGSGVYTVTCKAFSSTQALLGSSSVTVRSDETVPTLPSSQSMTDWIRSGINYDAVIDWSGCSDELSGIKRAYTRVYYDDGTAEQPVYYESVPSDKTYIVLEKKARIVVTVFDKAGNSARKEFSYDKFDRTAPMSPSVSIDPIVTAGEYAKSYTIELAYYDDTESGLAPVQHYLMNNVSYEYETGVGIVLTEQKNYSFVFYALDNVGNRSEYVKYELPSTVFDVKSPYLDVATVRTEIDLTNKDGVCKLSFATSDYKESGVASAVLKGKDYVMKREDTEAQSTFTVRFDCFDDNYMHRLVITDNVGNATEHVFSVDYFSDESINTLCKELARLYRETDFSDCSAQAKSRIDTAIESVNNLLNTSGNTSALIKACTAAKDLFLPVATTRYVIESSPQYASSSIVFTVYQDDFSDGSFGNSFELTMKDIQQEEESFVGKAGFTSGFTDCFSLQLTFNGEELISPLTRGISVSMNCSSGYLERQFALFDRASGQKIETTVVNNKLNFTLKKSADLVLVISGSRASVDYNQNDGKKTIEVFGRTWPLSTFLGIVLGIGFGAVAIGVLVLVFGRKRG